MSIATTCPSCKALFRLADELVGKTVKCQKCASMFIVPSGDATGTHAGIPLAPDEPPAPEPAAPPPTAAVALPPEPPPTVLLAADEREHVQDGPSKPPPLSEKSERRRPSEPKREPAKSGSSMMPFVLALVGLGLFLCLGCAGVSAVWLIGGTEKQPKKDGVVRFKDKKDIKFGGFKEMDKKDGFPKFNDFNEKDFPPPPPEGIAVVFDKNDEFHNNNALTTFDGMKLNKFYRVYTLKVEKGKTYEIRMNSNRIDSWLRLIDDVNITIREDDDSGGNQNSLIIYPAERDAVFRIEATSFAPATGPYTLIVKRR